MIDCLVFDCRVLLVIIRQIDKVEDWSLIYLLDSFLVLGFVV